MQDDEIVLGDTDSVNGFEILRKVVEMPVGTWRYLSEEPGVQHLGPMAQDFKTSFDLGDDDDTSIAVVDLCGVLFVSVQALQRQVAELQQRLEDLAPPAN